MCERLDSGSFMRAGVSGEIDATRVSGGMGRESSEEVEPGATGETNGMLFSLGKPTPPRIVIGTHRQHADKLSKLNLYINCVNKKTQCSVSLHRDSECRC